MSEPARHFRAIVEPPRFSRRLLATAVPVLLVYVGLVFAAVALSVRVPREPTRPRSSLVVTLLDAPQLGLPRSPGLAGSAPSAAAGSEATLPPLVGPEKRRARPTSVPKARPEAHAQTPSAGKREDAVGAAATHLGAAELPVGATVAPATAVAKSAALASEGSVGSGAAGSQGTSSRPGAGVGTGSGTGATGDHSGTGNKPGVASGDTEVLPFRDGMTRPSLVEKVDPVYTREARDANVSGLILTKCVITTNGSLKSCRIVKGIPQMDQAVLRALAKWRYTPVVYQGKTVAVEYVIPVRLTVQ